MFQEIKKTNTKGDSVIISYTLLIVIVLGLSSLVYIFLKLYLPSETAQCPEDVSVMIETSSCSLTNSRLNISLRNNGLFNIDAMFVRLAPLDREVRPQVNKNNETLAAPLTPENLVYVFEYNLAEFISQNPSFSSGEYELEIQPAVLKDKQIVLCANTAVESVACS